jgi:hypothetical protein
MNDDQVVRMIQRSCVVYALVAVIVFGVAWVDAEDAENVAQQACAGQPYETGCRTRASMNPFGPVMCAVVWPLWLSVKVARLARG